MTSRLRAGAREPGWPLALLFVGYPLWWLLGITLAMTVLTVALLIVELLHLPSVRFPRFGSVWVVFLGWVVIGAVVVQVDAPLAVGGWNTNRYLTWALRLFWYVAGTTLLLYLGNLADRTARARVFASFGWMFVWIVAGGLLGALVPFASFPSAVEVVLPQSLSANAFVGSLVHPNLAEQMQFVGVTRPSAPFPFANVWGLNFACFLPFFVVGWAGGRSLWKRRIAPVVLAIAVVPVVESLNRGLWLALALALVVLAVRALVAGNARVLLPIGVGVALLAVVVVLSPLRTTLADRFSSPNSNEGRGELASRGFDSTLSSPIVGFGTTRDVQGSLSSIAGGSTPTCPRCGAPSFGTQGQIFLTTFAQGYVGAAFYLGFLLLVVARAARSPGPAVTMALCVLTMHAATLSVYSADNLAVVPIFAAAGVLWSAADAAWQGVPLLVRLLGTRPRRVALVTACGGLVGLGVAIAAPRPTTASTQVLVAASDVGGATAPATLDTVAQLVVDGRVVDAVARAAHAPPERVEDHLAVTADPNTRVLSLTYTAHDAAAARAGSLASARAVLAVWSQAMRADQRADQRLLQARLDGLDHALGVVAHGRRSLRGRSWGPVGRSATRQLAGLQSRLVSSWTETDAAMLALRAGDVGQGQVVGAPSVLHPPTPWAQHLAEGLALGFLASPLLARQRRRPPTPNRGEKGPR